MPKFLIFLGMAFATYFTRYSMIAAMGDKMSPKVFEEHSMLRRWLRYVPAAVLAGLILPEVLAPKGHLEIGLPLWSLLAGCIVAWCTKNVVWTILSGMATFWILRFLIT